MVRTKKSSRHWVIVEGAPTTRADAWRYDDDEEEEEEEDRTLEDDEGDEDQYRMECIFFSGLASPTRREPSTWACRVRPFLTRLTSMEAIRSNAQVDYFLPPPVEVELTMCGQRELNEVCQLLGRRLQILRLRPPYGEHKPIFSLRRLGNCGLYELDIMGCTSLNNLDGLNNCKDLEVLRLVDCYWALSYSFSALSRLRNLRIVDLGSRDELPRMPEKWRPLELFGPRWPRHLRPRATVLPAFPAPEAPAPAAHEHGILHPAILHPAILGRIWDILGGDPEEEEPDPPGGPDVPLRPFAIWSDVHEPRETSLSPVYGGYRSNHALEQKTQAGEARRALRLCCRDLLKATDNLVTRVDTGTFPFLEGDDTKRHYTHTWLEQLHHLTLRLPHLTEVAVEFYETETAVALLEAFKTSKRAPFSSLLDVLSVKLDIMDLPDDDEDINDALHGDHSYRAGVRIYSDPKAFADCPWTVRLSQLLRKKPRFAERVSHLGLGAGHPLVLQPFAPLRHLTHVHLHVCDGLASLAPLRPLSATLESLELCCCGALTSLDPLSCLTRLSKLALTEVWALPPTYTRPHAALLAPENRVVHALWPLKSLAGSLRHLCLHGAPQLRSCEPLAALTGLRDLLLDGCSNLEDLSPLAGLAHLTSFSAAGLRASRSLTSLTKCYIMRELRLGGEDLWQYDLEWVAANCRYLRVLDLSAARSSFGLLHTSGALGCLTRLLWLEALAVPLTGVAHEDEDQLDAIGYLAEHHRLRSLDLSHGCLTRASWRSLTAFARLTMLSVADTMLDSLEGVERLALLRSLDVSGCSRLRDVKPLAQLKHLHTLNVSGCLRLRRLNPLTPLAMRRQLRQISADSSKRFRAIDRWLDRFEFDWGGTVLAPCSENEDGYDGFDDDF